MKQLQAGDIVRLEFVRSDFGLISAEGIAHSRAEVERWSCTVVSHENDQILVTLPDGKTVMVVRAEQIIGVARREHFDVPVK